MKKHTRVLSRSFIFGLTAALLVTLFASCGPRTIGYGVILWSENENVLPTGSVVRVVDQSRISNTYTVLPPAKSAGSSSNKTVETAQWRLSFFSDLKSANAFQASFAPYAKVYARSEKNALPIRAEASPSADMVYKLRQGEIMKVLRKSDAPSNESGFESYWYDVLTEGGVSGWVFGYLLTVYDQGPGLTAPQPAPDVDPVLANIMGTIWRPSYYGQMIDSGNYDLARFKTDYGFFPDPEKKRFTLSLPDYSIAFDYSALQKVESNRYAVQGTSLLITVRNDSELSLQYSYKGNITSTVVDKIDQNVADLITAEQKRRDDLYKAFIDHGNTLSSTAYGEIRLAPDKSFTWTDFRTLVPNVIPRTATGSGKVGFPLYLDKSLKTKFDGVLTFNMNGTDNTQDASFLYAFASDGVRFVYVPSQDITDNVVQRESFSPVIIFFTLSHTGS